ncbi:Uncharacterised protein [Vibrio cholerae]|nr:Uncharacterised protein [Vibrio cholerae]
MVLLVKVLVILPDFARREATGLVPWSRTSLIW